MSHEVHGLPAFYTSPPGRVARHFIAEGLHALWPELRGMNVLGLGWPAPYLSLWSQHAARCIALVPAPIADEPPPRPAAIMPEALIPLPDLSMDRILLVHALESAERPDALLRECWRVLRDNGRLLAVVPNRLGAWSLFDHTPLGQGHTYSRGQITRQLEARLFRVETTRPALFIPPFPQRWTLSGARLWESTGRHLAPSLSGAILAEAVKDTLATIPTTTAPNRRVAHARV